MTEICVVVLSLIIVVLITVVLLNIIGLFVLICKTVFDVFTKKLP